MPGIWELLIVLAIVLVIFGGGKIKNIASDLGAAMKNFKDGAKAEPKKSPKLKNSKKKK
jgi:sec-independent protein translocase protein TatA